MKKQVISLALMIAAIMILLFVSQCKDDKPDDNPPPVTNLSDINNTLGFGILNKVKGIWDGPVTSTTALGNYPTWIVDLRPISENQVSSKNELDTENSIHLSFFIAKYNNEYRVCFRNGGQFAGFNRVSYFLCDSVSETGAQSYYRFAEIKKGTSRAYTEVVLKGDSLLMKSFTNKNNSLPTSAPHMTWSAKLQDTTTCQAAVTHFDFPKKTLTKDFTSTFNGLTETIYYTNTGDPYSEAEQPYLGQSTISYTYLSGYAPNPARKVILMISAQPLIAGFTLNTGNLKYRSRYVTLAANNQSFVFNYMHPGTYYLYAFYDADGNNSFSSGDWVSTTNTTFTLPAAGTATATTQINFTIP